MKNNIEGTNDPQDYTDELHLSVNAPQMGCDRIRISLDVDKGKQSWESVNTGLTDVYNFTNPFQKELSSLVGHQLRAGSEYRLLITPAIYHDSRKLWLFLRRHYEDD